ncbi:MAG: metalloregulator ArsR/SmtB family transcription factor [Pseudomonadota bacterium]
MPIREDEARELADIFKILAHPDRIRMIEELRNGELDVSALAVRIGISAARISQHLSLLRSQRLVSQRRDGRNHHYRLTEPDIAGWIADGIDILSSQAVTLESSGCH